MDIIIRTELEQDSAAVTYVVKNAFETITESDRDEHFLVERLKISKAFVPDLSIVAEVDGRVVGYVLLTKIKIMDSANRSYTSLALAPIAVLQSFQGIGIGRRLIEAAHERAKYLEFESIILLGSEIYYPRFGYRPASDFEIQLPLDAPDANCMAIELVENSLRDISGVVKYPEEFQII